jgi:small ligand-binding sensory domain FIST
MRWISVQSAEADGAAAARDAAAAVTRELDGATPDLVLCFFGVTHVAAADELARELRERLAPGCLIGASANGVIWSEHEVESGPALTVLAALLPGVEVRPFVMVNAAWIAAAEDPDEFARCTPELAAAELVMVLADPFSFDIERCLGAFNRHAQGLRVVGGMAGAGSRPGANALVLNDWIANEGGVGLALSGALRADVVVSQGCRPVGPPLEVTRAEGNLVQELDGQPALERAEQVLRALPEREQEFLRNGLYVGRPVKPGASGPGDYLIRNLLGADRDHGVLAVGDVVAVRERIRLHVRDAATATEDLELLLAPQEFDARAEAALLFTCNGRGSRLFGAPDRDLSTLQSALGGTVPVAGMFCAGEIGPVGERNLLHGHTASIAILRPKPEAG